MTEKVTPKQIKAIDEYLATGDISQACQAAGVSRKTFYVWQREPVFRQALEDVTANALRLASARLVSLAEKATGILDSVMDDPKSTRSHKLRAAHIALDKVLRLRELVDLESRIRALEEKGGNYE